MLIVWLYWACWNLSCWNVLELELEIVDSNLPTTKEKEARRELIYSKFPDETQMMINSFLKTCQWITFNYFPTQCMPLLNPRIALGAKKAPSSVFESVKNLCSALGAVLSWLFLNMKWVQNATIMSPIGAPEVVWHDVKHVWIFWNRRNFMVMLTNMTKQI